MLPSRAEGVRRTVMEALSAGISVLCADLAHTRSEFGVSVIFVEFRDVDGYVEGIEIAVSGELLGDFDYKFQ